MPFWFYKIVSRVQLLFLQLKRMLSMAIFHLQHRRILNKVYGKEKYFMFVELCRKVTDNSLYREIHTLNLYSGFVFVLRTLRTEHMFNGESLHYPEQSVTFRNRKEAYAEWDKVLSQK